MTKEEEMALRELAAGQCTIASVTAALGPLSLWSKSAFDAEVRKAVLAEREACAKACEELDAWSEDDPGSSAATAIRARSQA